MEPLKTFFENPFEGQRYSIDNFKKFSEDHLARITANPGAPGGAVAALVAPTGAAHINFFGEITDVAVSSSVQQGITKAVDQKFHAAIDFMKNQEGLIKYVFGKESPAYQEFYPYGITEYTRATKANFEELIMRFKAAATNNLNPAVPATLADELQALHDDYQELRAAQLGKKGNTDTQRSERDTARTALEHQLWKNIHTIAIAHLGNVAACTAYFDESIIKNKSKSEEEEKPETEPEASVA